MAREQLRLLRTVCALLVVFLWAAALCAVPKALYYIV
jgi:hypothetical protein